MEKTTNHVNEYRENQDIDFDGITSFKVQNHGESTVDVNTIPVYPGQTVTMVEADGTFSDFKLKAVFTESSKLSKFKAIYKQLDTASGFWDNAVKKEYTVTLYNYETADIVEFSQNIGGHTILTRSFDGGITFDASNDIDLGYIPANEVVKYDRGGRMDTNAIQFRNVDLGVNSEIFVVGKIIETPWRLEVEYRFQYIDPAPYTNLDVFVKSNKTGNLLFKYFEIPTGIESHNEAYVVSGLEQRNYYGNVLGYHTPYNGIYYSITRLETGEVKYYKFNNIGFEELETLQEIPSPF